MSELPRDDQRPSLLTNAIRVLRTITEDFLYLVVAAFELFWTIVEQLYDKGKFVLTITWISIILLIVGLIGL
jgi:hypothetical protein